MGWEDCYTSSSRDESGRSRTRGWRGDDHPFAQKYRDEQADCRFEREGCEAQVGQHIADPRGGGRDVSQSRLPMGEESTLPADPGQRFGFEARFEPRGATFRAFHLPNSWRLSRRGLKQSAGQGCSFLESHGKPFAPCVTAKRCRSRLAAYEDTPRVVNPECDALFIGFMHLLQPSLAASL